MLVYYCSDLDFVILCKWIRSLIEQDSVYERCNQIKISQNENDEKPMVGCSAKWLRDSNFARDFQLSQERQQFNTFVELMFLCTNYQKVWSVQVITCTENDRASLDQTFMIVVSEDDGSFIKHLLRTSRLLVVIEFAGSGTRCARIFDCGITS